jgi:hypothetical protein
VAFFSFLLLVMLRPFTYGTGSFAVGRSSFVPEVGSALLLPLRNREVASAAVV